MDILSLYYFSELAKDLHITRTANRLHVSQQTLSNHIQRLEEYYETQLLYRKPTMSLTCAGEFVLKFALLTNKENSNLKDILADINHQERGLLRVGASLPRAAISLPAILPQFAVRYPNVEVRLTDNISANLEQMILKGDIDIALILMGETNPKLVKRHLLDDQVYLCVSDRLLKKHYGDETENLKERSVKGARTEDFIRIPFSLFSNRLGDQIHRCFEDASCTPNIIFTSTYSQLMIPFCSQGLSACFITRMNFDGLRDQIAEDVNIFPLHFRGQPLTQEISLIHHRERYLTHYAEYFIDTLFQAFANMERTCVARKV